MARTGVDFVSLGRADPFGRRTRLLPGRGRHDCTHAAAGRRAPPGQRTQRRHPGPQLPGARSPGRGRFRRRFARAGHRGAQDRRAGHRHVRGVLHGRDGQDRQSRTNRAEPGSDGRLLAGRLDHPARPALLEGRAPGRGRRQLRQYHRRDQGRVGLLRHQRQRRGGRALDSGGPEILFLPDQFLGAWLKERTGRDNMHIWLGECHVHAGIRPDEVRARRRRSRTPTC